jgi:hypothetical protein
MRRAVAPSCNVATASGGIPEVVEHCETGLLVPVGDHRALAAALVELLLDVRRRQHMGEAGRRRFQPRFTALRMVDETLGAYAELCASSEATPAARGLVPDPAFDPAVATSPEVSNNGSTLGAGRDSHGCLQH